MYTNIINIPQIDEDINKKLNLLNGLETFDNLTASPCLLHVHSKTYRIVADIFTGQAKYETCLLIYQDDDLNQIDLYNIFKLTKLKLVKNITIDHNKKIKDFISLDNARIGDDRFVHITYKCDQEHKRASFIICTDYEHIIIPCTNG